MLASEQDVPPLLCLSSVFFKLSDCETSHWDPSDLSHFPIRNVTTPQLWDGSTITLDRTLNTIYFIRKQTWRDRPDRSRQLPERVLIEKSSAFVCF